MLSEDFEDAKTVELTELAEAAQTLLNLCTD